jgi:hypothetical protein
MGAGGASTGGGGGGVGPAGLVTKTGKTGTKKDAQKASERYEFRNRGATKLQNQKIISPALNY